MPPFKANVFVLPFIFLSVACSSVETRPESDHYKDGRFFNLKPVDPPGFFEVAWHILFGRNGKWPGNELALVPKPGESPQPPSKIRLTFVGHATVLIEIGQWKILTDPVWSDRVGPYSWAGPKRARPPGIAWEDLPRIDLVIISHNHYDHLDLPTLRKLSERDAPRVLVPLGNERWLSHEGIQNVRELDWWEVDDTWAGLHVTFTPAQHNSGRGLGDANRTLWGSYWIKTAQGSAYFAGDTAYGPHFQMIRERLGAVDVALLPIGAYEPRPKMRKFHMDPDDAVQAQIDLEAHRALGIHFGAFQLTAEDFDEPPRDLREVLSNRKRPAESFVVVDEGHSFS